MLNVKWWQNRLYPNELQRDAVARFIRTLTTYVKPEHFVLDVGAGAGHLNAYEFKGKIKKMVGVDYDPRVKVNPLLDEGVVCGADAMPFPDNSFDLVFSVYVMEHIDDPASFTSNVFRVLKPGGYYLSITPNRFHYVPLIASITPTAFHKWVNKRRGRDVGDTFPTYYRLNSMAAQRFHFSNAGFKVKDIGSVEVQPNYLKFCVPAFLIGAAYERTVNMTELLSQFRVNLISTFQKPH